MHRYTDGWMAEWLDGGMEGCTYVLTNLSVFLDAAANIYSHFLIERKGLINTFERIRCVDGDPHGWMGWILDGWMAGRRDIRINKFMFSFPWLQLPKAQGVF